MKNINEIKPFVYSIELRDIYTQGHSERVAIYSRDFAKYLKLSKDDIENVYIAGLLHDLGKIGIPDAILLKPGKLEKDEFDIIKTHSSLSGDIVEKMDDFSYLADIVRHHHENFDGSGYPDGLKGDEIPYLSKILTLADVFDALTTRRVYRKAFTKEEALTFMEKMKNKFDPYLYKEFKKFIADKEVIKEKLFEVEEGIDKILHNNVFFIDLFTKTLNREGFLAVFGKSADEDFYGSLVHINIKNFKNYNRIHGVKKGDELIKTISNEMKNYFNAVTSLDKPEKRKIYLIRTVADKFFLFLIGRRGEFLEYKVEQFIKDIKDKYGVKLYSEFLIKDVKLKDYKKEIGFLV